MPASPPSVEFAGVSKRYASGITALENVSFSIPPGQIVALLGTSGSGKTTALKLINRIEEASSGSVLLDGQPVSKMDSMHLRRSIGYVIQEGGLFPHWTVAENVATVPRLQQWPDARIQERVEVAMQLAQISGAEFCQRYPATLSGGQRQRVAIARALAAEPRLLLLDEAFGALDPITRDALHVEMKALIAKLSVTTIMVTHDVVEAFKLADRVALLDKGRLIQFGTPEELVLAPCDEFSREFFAQHGLDIRLRYLHLERVIPFLKHDASPSNGSVELDGVQTLADALDKMAGVGSEQFIVRCGDGTGHGPYRRKDVWALLRGASI